MYPFARGSGQLTRQLLDVKVFINKSHSAPELSVTAFSEPMYRRQVQPRKPLPPRSLAPLMSDHQLIALSHLPTHEALALLADSLTEHILAPHKGSIVVLLYSVYQWARNLCLDTHQISVLLSIYTDAAQFCLENLWRTQQDMYQFFKESLLGCCVEHPPNSACVFSPEQCRAILLSFCNRFLFVLPLFRLISQPNKRLILTWNPPSDELEIASQLL